MAAILANLRMVSAENGIFRNHEWYYDDIADPADVNTAGFFNGAVAMGMQVGDKITYRRWTTAVPTTPHPVTADSLASVTTFWVLQANLETDVVDVSNGDAATMTDSD